MKRLFFKCLTLLLLLTSTISIAQKKQNDQDEVVAVSKEEIYPMIAYQPKSPLQVSFIELRVTSRGSEDFVVKVKNVGKKTVTGYKIAGISSIGISKSLERFPGSRNKWINPGKEVQIFGSFKRTKKIEQDSSNVSANSKPIKAVHIIMIVWVELSDGTIYEEQTAYEQLTNYFRKLSDITTGKSRSLNIELRMNSPADVVRGAMPR